MIFEHVPFESTPWLPSPTATVERKMLERIGDEVARATSIVRYAPLSAFPEHVHEKGEEFIVLSGLSDEHADYPEGSYVRNPPGSRHRPFSEKGCIIFVKLRQFAPDDTRHSVTRLETALGEKTGASPVLLHAFGRERVSLLDLAAGATFDFGEGDAGVELFVIRGSLDVGAAHCGLWSWLRAPRPTAPIRTEAGCKVWVKQGHLPAEG